MSPLERRRCPNDCAYLETGPAYVFCGGWGGFAEAHVLVNLFPKRGTVR